MKKINFLFILIILLISCQTMEDTFIHSIKEDSMKKIEEVEMLLLRFKFNKDRAFLKQANVLIEQLDKLAENNKYFEAKVFGLYGELALLQNNIPLVNEYISEIEKRNNAEEKLYILKAKIEKNREKQEKYILKNIHKPDTSEKLKLILANNYFYSAKFSRAVDLYDEAFSKLPEIYQQVYKKNRDLSYHFINSPPKNADIIDILLKEKITIKQMIQICLSESNSLSSITDDSSFPVKKVYEKLKEKHYLYNSNKYKIALNDVIKRKDIAYFLLHIVVDLENDPTLLNKYINDFTYDVEEEDAEIELSPISDIKTNDYFYNAVLVLLEREIIELPDGENFFPERSMSGLRFYEIIKILK
ncbi:MAG: hypothetical protein KAT05_12015 [Spirochaetes bacterium]|nr:hypothetical protein [Spirochaetota bacterium]